MANWRPIANRDKSRVNLINGKWTTYINTPCDVSYYSLFDTISPSSALWVPGICNVTDEYIHCSIFASLDGYCNLI